MFHLQQQNSNGVNDTIIKMATFQSGAEYANEVRKRIGRLLADNKPFRIAVYNDVARKSVRIFEDGIKSDGSQIGQYATQPPIYVNPNFAPRKGAIRIAGGGVLQGLLPTRGKPTKENPEGESVFTEETKHRGVRGTKAGDPHRTTYLIGGYKELRNRTGRRIDRVNLRFTNNLFLDWANTGSISAPPKPTKVSPIEYVIKLKRPENVLKRIGLEDKYGIIFKSTGDEIKNFVETLQFNYNEFMKGGK